MLLFGAAVVAVVVAAVVIMMFTERRTIYQLFRDKQPTVDVDHVHELDHDVAHEEGDGEEGEEARVAGLAPHHHLGN